MSCEPMVGFLCRRWFGLEGEPMFSRTVRHSVVSLAMFLPRSMPFFQGPSFILPHPESSIIHDGRRFIHPQPERGFLAHPFLIDLIAAGHRSDARRDRSQPSPGPLLRQMGRGGPGPRGRCRPQQLHGRGRRRGRPYSLLRFDQQGPEVRDRCWRHLADRDHRLVGRGGGVLLHGPGQLWQRACSLSRHYKSFPDIHHQRGRGMGPDGGGPRQRELWNGHRPGLLEQRAHNIF
ncbi:MAG: hypothetical protein A4E30_00669 [Methanomassiliicoccales archaeon PtaB.Bin215]|nr:MAG: hypothetical protein A4E30_00669 [Methanomassiliicoccales archaeon PtaB.Bin215]